MRKMSKSDLPVDREAEAREREGWLFNQKPSQHFAIGTFVTYNRRHWKILGYSGDLVMLLDGSDSVTLKNPYFMRGIK